MSIGRKLALALILGIAMIQAGNAYLRINQEIGRLRSDQIQDLTKQGRILAAAIERIWETDGDAFARRVVEEMRVSGDVQLAWIWLDEIAAHDQLSPAERGALQAGEQVTLVDDEHAGHPSRFSYVPIAIPDSRPAALVLSEPLSPPASYIRLRILQTVLTALLILILCAILAGRLVTWLVSRPLTQLCEQARRVGAGDLSARLDFAQRDEVGALAREIDGMCDRLGEANQRAAAETEARISTLEQLRHSDRLKTVGQLASGVAHELGTPLNVVLGRAKMIASAAPAPADAHRNAEIIVQQTERMTTIIRQLLDFARREQPHTKVGRPDQIAARAVEMLSPLAGQHSVDVRLETCEDPPEIFVDEDQMLQALANLIVNGIQAMPDGGRLTVGVSRRRVTPPVAHGGPQAEYATVHVEDEGVGVPPALVAHVFEPFFTTKGVGVGTGLGLSVAYGIVQDHGGWITVEHPPARGSRFLVYLPLHTVADTTSQAEAS